MDKIDDKDCIPLVKYFNDNGLKTAMCCSGVNHGYNLFWISFTKKTTKEDVWNFLKRHNNKEDDFYKNMCCPIQGWFVLRLWGTDGETWNYVANSPEEAKHDLEYFLRNREEKK